MLLPAQMTQRGGICSDSQRITYTPAAGRERGDTGPCELPPPHGRAGREGGGWAAACGRWPLGKWDRRRQPRGRTGPCTSPCKKRLGKLVIKVPSPRKKKRKERLSPPVSSQTNANVSSLSESTFETLPKKKKKRKKIP